MKQMMPSFKIIPQLSEKDRARLDFLLSTWEERKILPRDLLALMRAHIGTRIVALPPLTPFIPAHRHQVNKYLLILICIFFLS